MSESKNGLLDLFAKILAVLGFITALIAYTNEFLKLTTDTQGLRIASLAGFIVYFLSTLWLAFKVTDVKPAWRWAGLVILYILTVPYFIWVGTWIRPSDLEATTCTAYGIKITSPKQGADVGAEIEVSGFYEVEPPKDSILLVYVSSDGRGYWPQNIVEVNPVRKTWRGKFLMGGDPPQVADVMVAIMGKPGRVLFDYFAKVGQETGRWPAIEKLTDDMVECDRVSVKKTK